MKNEFNGNVNPSNDSGSNAYSPLSLLFSKRILMIQGQVNTQMAVNLISQIKALEADNPNKPIELWVNSPGGSVIDGLAIFDIMRQVKCPIVTVANGMQASMGSILMAGGDTRIMMPNSKILVHQIMGGAAGGTQHSDFEISNAVFKDLHERLKNVYVEFTGLTHEYWDMVGERDTWLSAEQALEIGYIHQISDVKKDRGPFFADSKRPEEKQNIFKKVAQEAIDKMSAEEIIVHLNNGQANEGQWGAYRPELATKLASFERFWTPARKAAEQKKVATAAATNDNKAKATITRKKKAAPKTAGK